jgi:hypothetical protein
MRTIREIAQSLIDDGRMRSIMQNFVLCPGKVDRATLTRAPTYVNLKVNIYLKCCSSLQNGIASSGLECFRLLCV